MLGAKRKTCTENQEPKKVSHWHRTTVLPTFIRYVPYQIAVPMLFSLLAFRRPLTTGSEETLTKKYKRPFMSVERSGAPEMETTSSWSGWFWRSPSPSKVIRIEMRNRIEPMWK